MILSLLWICGIPHFGEVQLILCLLINSSNNIQSGEKNHCSFFHLKNKYLTFDGIVQISIILYILGLTRIKVAWIYGSDSYK